ncbi:MAG: hypothetical protein H2212_03655 [Ruminococcus sp.]|nr:hypothetical protein [Ruminococcus sp.]
MYKMTFDDGEIRMIVAADLTYEECLELRERQENPECYEIIKQNLSIGDVYIGGNNQRVTILKVDNKKDVILFLFEGASEPFGITNSYEINDGYIRWSVSRYRNDLESAIETFNKLVN